MKFLSPLFCLILFLFLLPLTQAQKNFKSNNWTLLEGKENCQGPQDFSGDITINSIGEKIVIEATIQDENIVVSEDYTSSDRFELWLSIDEYPSENLYYVKKDSLTKFNPGYRFYKQAHSSNQPVAVSFGTVHYTILPAKEKKVLIQDRSHYDWIEKSTGEKPGSIEQGVNVKMELTKVGYKLTISLSPLALGFIKIPTMNEIKLKLHIYDMDKDKSSSVHSITGNKNEYQTIQFSKALHTNVTSVSSFIFDSLAINPVLMFNSKGFWSGVTKAEFKLDSLGTDKVSAIMRTPIGSRKWKEKNTIEIEKLSYTIFQFQQVDTALQLKGELKECYFSRGKEFNSYRPIPNEEWEFKGLQKEFTYQDHSNGIILIQINPDTICNYTRLKTFILTKLKGDKTLELLRIIEDPCKSISTIGSLTIKDLKIEKIYWQKEGIALMVEGRVPTKGDMKFRVGFQGDKAIITPIKK